MLPRWCRICSIDQRVPCAASVATNSGLLTPEPIFPKMKIEIDRWPGVSSLYHCYVAAVVEWHSLLTVLSLARCATSSAVDSERAFWGQISMHLGWDRPEHRSHITISLHRLSSAIAPKSQASMHQPQPTQRTLSNRMVPLASLVLRAWRGHAAMHGGSSHWRQAILIIVANSGRTVRMRESSKLNSPSFSAEHANSQS